MEKDVGVPVLWNKLEDSTWYEVETSKNYKYYYNKETKETRWDKPKLEKEEKRLREDKKQEKEDKEGKLQVQETKHLEVSLEDIKNYKELIDSLKLPNNINYEQSIPKLLFDPRYKKIPQSHRKRLFNQLRRELLEEKASKQTNLYSLEELKDEEYQPEKKKKTQENIKSNESHKKIKEHNQESHRDTHLRKITEDNFINLLHENIKMPFYKGDIEPLDENLLNKDPRFNNEYLENKNYLYKRFVREFLKSRIELFESKLEQLDSQSLNLDLEQVVELVGSKLFNHLPSQDLKRSLNKWKEEKKKELLESFKNMLKESLYYRQGTIDDNLEKAKLKFYNDERYKRLETFSEERERLILERLKELEEIHKSSKNISIQED